MGEDRAVITPGVMRWLRDLLAQGPKAKRPRGTPGYRARREGLTDLWLRDRQTGDEMLSADVPPEHIPLGDRYEIVGEGRTDAGRRALSGAEGEGGGDGW